MLLDVFERCPYVSENNSNPVNKVHNKYTYRSLFIINTLPSKVLQEEQHDYLYHKIKYNHTLYHKIK